MSLCPSSSHQLVAAAIAFRRARRKFPKDFGLESASERASGNTKTEAATCREGSVNQAKSSSTLVRRACNSSSDYVHPPSARGRDYDRPHRGRESPIGCSRCRTRNVLGEDVSELRNECSGGDTVDVVLSRECGGSCAPSGADSKNGFVKPVTDRDRYDVASRSTDDGEAVRTVERIPRPTSCRHWKTRCPCSNPVNNHPSCDSTSHERRDRVACGDFTAGDRSRERFAAATSCHGTSIDLDGSVEEEEEEEDADARGRVPDVEDSWTRANVLTTRRKLVDSAWRCECRPRESSTPSVLPRSPCDHCRDDGCYHRHDYRCDYSHRCYQHRDSSRESDVPGEKAQHKSWRDQTRGENRRLYARRCYSKEYSGIMSASRERNDEECREKKGDNDDEGEDEDDDSGVAVINHKDSMCILAEKYKAGGKWRGRKCEDGDRSGDKDECNKSLTSGIVDQPESPLVEIANAVPRSEGPSVKHVCRAARCGGCETAAAVARTCDRGCGRRGSPEGEFARLKSPLNETAATRCCSSRAPCRRVF